MQKEAFQAAWPIVLGYIVLGIPCGILGVAAGMDVWMIAIMSLLFYSGAGQYMIPNMWLAGNPISAIVASVALVNTRQMLYGASLSQFCGSAGKRLAFIFGATVTDESFGVNLARMINGNWSVKHALLVNLFSLTSWTVSQCRGCAHRFGDLAAHRTRFICHDVAVHLLAVHAEGDSCKSGRRVWLHRGCHCLQMRGPCWSRHFDRSACGRGCRVRILERAPR